MNHRKSLSPASKLTVVALLVAAAGFVIQIVSGVDVPTVPPGLVILLVAAGLVVLSNGSPAAHRTLHEHGRTGTPKLHPRSTLRTMPLKPVPNTIGHDGHE